MCIFVAFQCVFLWYFTTYFCDIIWNKMVVLLKFCDCIK